MKYRKENKEEVRLDVPKGMKEIYKEYAKKRGMSLAALIMYLLESEMEKDGFYSAEEAAKQQKQAMQAEIDAIKAGMKPPAAK